MLRPFPDCLKKFWRAAEEFLFAPSSDVWLSILRVVLGVQIILYCLSLRRDWNEVFASTPQGFLSRDLMEGILNVHSHFVPRLGWLISIGGYLGLSEQRVLGLCWITLLIAGGALLVGLFCRAAAVLAWLLYLAAVKSGSLLTYGVDNMTTIGLFYLALAPLPDRFSIDHKLRAQRTQDRHRLGFFRRVLQLHLCVVYFFGGLLKCLGPGWWNGNSMWRALTRPPFDILPMDFILSARAWLPAIGITVWILELGYPIFIWPRRTRAIWLTSILLMHIGIGLALGLYLFASIMIGLNLAAFGPGLILDRQEIQDAT